MSTQETFKIFCGNLSPVTNGNDLRTLFSKHGTVVEADVIAGKNFGFVHMSSEAEGMNALYVLQGYILNGEKMTVQRAINSKRASAAANLMSLKRNIIGQGVSSIDDFESYYEINDNFNTFTQDLSNFLKQPTPSLSPVNYNISSINASNMSDNSSGRPSPLLLSSASSTSYTPEHVVQQQSKSVENQLNNFENLLINQDNKSLCSICNEEYNNHIHLPKILSCKHTFCTDCLTSLCRGFEIKCPLGCPYITILHESGVTGLTTNQTKIIKQDDMLSGMPTLPDNQNGQRFEQEVCCVCLCTPPSKMCSVQKHQIMKESDASTMLKHQLHILLEISVNTLRNVMAMQATLKERMQYTLHSLNKFSEELKLKIEGEEMEQNMQQSLLVDLHEMNDTLMNITNIGELLQKFDKVNASSQNIASKYRHCSAKDTVNGALQSILLELKEPLADTCLNQLGLSAKEAFSLASTLKENADKGNFANVLLIYLLSDLLFTRYRPNVMNPQIGFTPFSHSFGTSHLPSVSSSLPDPPEQEHESEEPLMSDSHELFDINTVIETTKAIESSAVLNGSPSLEQERFSPPIVSSALSLGLSNFSLLGHSDNASPVDEEEPEFTHDDLAEEDAPPRPFSYLDAVKKPAKNQSNSDTNHGKQLIKSIYSPIKPSTKFPHCWMVISVNGINAGRIIFQLRPDKAPNMCDNFIGLCTGRSSYGYKGTHFFKNGDGFLVGGDVENDDGTGGYSVYDKQKFEADLCPLKDDVGMVRFKGIGTSDKGRGMVGSQFMIWYTEREFKKFSFSLVFGKVVDGLEIVQEAANHNLHKVAIKVEECGAI